MAEIDGLNHYIGMRPLEEAAQLERSLSFVLIGVTALLVVGAIFVHSKWAALLAFPAVLFPIFFMADMYYWLRNFGQNLDPTAALSNYIEPFVPPLLGSGFIGQFKTIASLGPSGFYLAILASILILVGLYFQRKAYKPLVDAGKGPAMKLTSATKLARTFKAKRSPTESLSVIVDVTLTHDD